MVINYQNLNLLSILKVHYALNLHRILEYHFGHKITFI